tara:strand:+ start:40 stop:996 length:957 start_codon:yes stop_codon:yes gene_type:complete
MESNLHKLIVESGYFGNVITKKLPKNIDNRLYTLINLIGGLTTRDVYRFAEEATEDEIRNLSVLVTNFPSTQHEILPYAGGYKYLVTSPEYKEIVKLIKKPKILREDDGYSTTNDYTYFNDYISPTNKKALFKLWDRLGKADYDTLKLFGVEEDSFIDENLSDFLNVGDVLYPALAIEWMGGVENTDFAKAPWQETSEMGFERLKFKVEPIRFDYLFDESADFGEHGYACWDIRVLIDKDGDLELPVNPEYIDNYGDYTPFVQDLFPESARNKLSPFRNYTEDQFELIENLWDQYDRYRHLSSQFCRVEVVLVDKKEL